MRFGFVTCVQLGLSCMETIYAVGGRLEVALTLRDDCARRKSGRIYLDDFCSHVGLPLRKIAHINAPEAHEAIREAALDWLFIIGWSQIAAASILALPRQGVLGMHPTLLPEGRGRAAIPWAILKGLRETGVTLFKLDEGMDTGPIVAQTRIPLGPTTTATSLYAQVDEAHTRLMRDTYPRLQNGTATMVPQDESRASLWPGRAPADGEIDLTGSVWEAERLVRATTHPYPGAFFRRDGDVTRVWNAKVHASNPGGNALAFHDGWLEILP